MSDIALCVKVFSRAEKLGNLLDSVTDTAVDAVYIADDGESSEEKRALYEAEYPFDLTVVDLEYDAGLGHGRNAVVEASDEPYLLVVDSDHELPPRIDDLLAQLEAVPDLGGVSGLLFERGGIHGTCHDLYEHGDVLVRDVRSEKTVERVAGQPFIEFDFVPNVALFRRECLEDAAWDPEYIIGKEHLDFYVTHWQETDWSFGVNPTVLFDHYPGGDAGYVADRESKTKLQRSKDYFLSKWGYRQLALGRTDWVDSTRPLGDTDFLAEQITKRVLLTLPPAVLGPLMDLRDAVRTKRNRPPL
jgi:glycosyltransferase involved in cell wall biosynthesis